MQKSDLKINLRTTEDVSDGQKQSVECKALHVVRLGPRKNTGGITAAEPCIELPDSGEVTDRNLLARQSDSAGTSPSGFRSDRVYSTGSCDQQETTADALPGDHVLSPRFRTTLTKAAVKGKPPLAPKRGHVISLRDVSDDRFPSPTASYWRERSKSPSERPFHQLKKPSRHVPSTDDATDTGISSHLPSETGLSMLNYYSA